MRKSKFSEAEIIGILKQHEAGRKIAELAREHAVSEATIYTWKAKYGGLEVSEAQRLKALEDENRRLKHLVADLSLDKEALKAVIRKMYGLPRGSNPNVDQGRSAQMYSASLWVTDPGHDEVRARLAS